MNLHQRAARTNAVLAVLRDRPFDWRRAATCIHLARAQLAAFGHKPPPVPRFQSPLGAKKALAARGCTTLGELIDQVLPGKRIPPALMIVGDLAMLPGEQGFEALTVCAGGGMLIGWHGSDLSRMLPFRVSARDVEAAWRL